VSWLFADLDWQRQRLPKCTYIIDYKEYILLQLGELPPSLPSTRKKPFSDDFQIFVKVQPDDEGPCEADMGIHIVY
jgi:hypothetical protein